MNHLKWQIQQKNQIITTEQKASSRRDQKSSLIFTKKIRFAFPPDFLWSFFWFLIFPDIPDLPDLVATLFNLCLVLKGLFWN